MTRKALYLIFFQAFAFAFSSLGAQRDPEVPELPHLTLDNFSPGIREQIFGPPKSCEVSSAA